MDILLVEDSKSDIKIALRTFADAELKSDIYVVNNGQEALDYIYHRGKYRSTEDFPRPDLILLDINMPKMNGFELLKKLKSDPEYSFIPVIMLTSSKEEEDIIKSYKNGAASFIQKPINHKDFVQVVDALGFYWGVINKLPNPAKCRKNALEGEA